MAAKGWKKIKKSTGSGLCKYPLYLLVLAPDGGLPVLKVPRYIVRSAVHHFIPGVQLLVECQVPAHPEWPPAAHSILCCTL